MEEKREQNQGKSLFQGVGLKKPGKEQLFIGLLIGILLLVIAIPTEGQKLPGEEEARAESTQQTEEADAGDYEGQMEKRLAEALSRVEGVGKTEVMITVKGTREKIIEKDHPLESQTVEETDSQGGIRKTLERNSQESTIYEENRDGEKTPYVRKELEPEVEGIIVIAEGGGSSVVRQHILDAVLALFPVDAHKIKVMKMEVEGSR